MLEDSLGSIALQGLDQTFDGRLRSGGLRSLAAAVANLG
jgi:hypothetical protein